MGLVVRPIAWLVTGAVALLCVCIATMYLLTRPDQKRIDQEQRAVFSSYLFEYPLVARPLPTLCDDLQKRNSGVTVKVLVPEKTLAGVSTSSVIIGLPQQKLHARGVPLSTFDNFLVRNLASGSINSVPEPSNVKLEYLPESNSEGRRNQGVSVVFSKVGFNSDFSWAMFYAELTCGTQTGTEYVYLTRDWKHGQQWYVAGVDRLSGSRTTEQVPDGGY